MLSRVLALTCRPRLLSSGAFKAVPGREIATAKTSSESRCPYCRDISYFGDGVQERCFLTLGGLGLLAVLWNYRNYEIIRLAPSNNVVGDCPECNRCAECASKTPSKSHRCI